MSSFAKRVLTGSSLAVAVVLLLLVDTVLPRGLVPWAMASLLAALGVWELARMGTLRVLRPRGPLYGAVGLVVLAALPLSVPLVELPDQLSPGRSLGVLYLLTAGAAGLLALTTGGPGKGLVLLLALWAVPPLFGLAFVQAELGTRGLAALVLLAKIGDVFGYFVGRKIGRRHPFPRLSPGKTVAGCVASLVAGVAAGAAVAGTGLLSPGSLGLFGGALAGLAVNVVSQAGDLAESAVKRHAGVKDSSGLVGPSGGVLDVVDSLLLATPVALLLFPVLFAA